MRVVNKSRVRRCPDSETCSPVPDLEHKLVDEVSDGLDPSQDVEAVGEGDGEPPDETVEGRALDAACEAHRVGGGPNHNAAFHVGNNIRL